MKGRSVPGAIGTVAIAGCLSDRLDDRDDERNESGDSSTGEPQAKPDEPETVDGNAEDWFNFGEWYEGDQFGVMVEGIEATTSVNVTFAGRDEQRDIPDDGQLVTVDFVLKNLSPDRSYTPRGSRFSAIVDGRVYEPVGSIEGLEVCSAGECDDGLDLDWIKKAEARSRLSIGKRMEHGEKREFWIGTVMPDAIRPDEISVAYGTDYRARWSG